MKRLLFYLMVILLCTAAGLFLADRYHTDLEIREFDRQMKEWKKQENNPERK